MLHKSQIFFELAPYAITGYCGCETAPVLKKKTATFRDSQFFIKKQIN